MANGQEANVDKVLKDCVIKIEGHELPLELLPMRIGGFDIVLGMDWLTANRANINCAQKTLDVHLPNGSRIEIKGDKPRKTFSLISLMKAEKCLRKGHKSFLLYVISEKEEKKIEDVPVVAEFEDIFLKDLPG
jgi:hypothetical protein